MRGIARDDGAVAVEAAVVLPLLLLLLIGIIESALWLRDVAAVAAAARHGARIASAEPRRDSMVVDAAAAVAGSALPMSGVEELWVYEADAAGQPMGGDCTSRCVRLRWNGAQRAFTAVSGTWPPTSVNACAGDPRAMSVGVYVRARHNLTFPGLLDSSAARTIGDRAVMRFEPLTARSCGAGLS